MVEYKESAMFRFLLHDSHATDGTSLVWADSSKKPVPMTHRYITFDKWKNVMAVEENSKCTI